MPVRIALFRVLDKHYDTGIYLIADDIEKELLPGINLSKYGMEKVSGRVFINFIQEHSLTKKAFKSGFKLDIEFGGNKIECSKNSIHSYTASVITDFIRNVLLNLGRNLTFETVMSQPSKIEILKKANELGYKS